MATEFSKYTLSDTEDVSLHQTDLFSVRNNNQGEKEKSVKVGKYRKSQIIQNPKKNKNHRRSIKTIEMPSPTFSAQSLKNPKKASGLERIISNLKGKRNQKSENELGLIPIEEDHAGGIKDDLERFHSSSVVIEYFGDDVSDYQKMEDSKEPYFYHKHVVNFSLAQYFEFFFYHFLTFSIFGPFCNLFCCFFKKQKYLFHNLQLRGCGFPVYRQHVFWAITVYLYYLIYFKHSKMTDINTIYSVMLSFVLRSSVIAGKYATFPKNQARMIREVKMTDNQIMAESMIGGWFQQNDQTVKAEIESALKRREIDDILFKVAFMTKLSKEAETSYQELKKKRNTYNKIEIHQGRNAKKRIEYYDSKLIFEYLVKKFNKKYLLGLRIKMGLFILMMAFLYGFLPGIIRVIFGQTFAGETTDLKIGFYLYALAMTVLACGIYMFFGLARIDMERRGYLLKQLGQMISAKKLPSYKLTKFLPTINLLDQLSLNSWVELRKLSIDYGKRYFFRHEIFLPVMFFTGLINLIIALSLVFFDFTKDDNLKIELQKFQLFMGASFIASYFMFFNLLFKAAAINSQFDEHIEILKVNKQLYMDLLFFKDFYFFNGISDRQEVYAYDSTSLIGKRSSSYVHLRLANEIIDILGDKLVEKVEDYLRNLIFVNDACVEELGDLSKFWCLKVLGFEVSNNTVTNLLIAFISVTVTAYEILYSK